MNDVPPNPRRYLGEEGTRKRWGPDPGLCRPTAGGFQCRRFRSSGTEVVDYSSLFRTAYADSVRKVQRWRQPYNSCLLPVEKPTAYRLRRLTASRLPHQQRYGRICGQNLGSAAHETGWHALVPSRRPSHACTPCPSVQRPLACNSHVTIFTPNLGCTPQKMLY